MASGSAAATACPAATEVEELTTTETPAAPSATATDSPMPLEEPVTMATLPCRSMRFTALPQSGALRPRTHRTEYLATAHVTRLGGSGPVPAGSEPLSRHPG